MAFQHLDPKRARRRTCPSRRFKYEPLKAPRHIRLLKLNDIDLLASENWRATKSPRLPYYEMVQVPLDSLPEYTALSYTWGRPKRTHVLKISGEALAITASLAEALRALPRIAPTEYLWLDQVCINQADDKEKNHQVQIMGEIYANAHKVIIWTGGEIKGLQLAVYTYTTPGRQHYEGGVCGTDETLDWIGLVDPSPLWRLLLRPWFRRAWVVQEAVLAKEAVVVAGSCQLTIEELSWALCWPATLSPPMKSKVAGGKRFQDFHSAATVLHTIFGLRHPSLTRMPSVHMEADAFDSLIMDSLATNFTSDPRDHVYAFLGFQKNPNVSIVPDYSLSVPEAFTRAASALIRGTNSLELFRFLPKTIFHTQLLDEDRTGLPSWVPDWSSTSTGGRILRSQDDWLKHMYRLRPNFDAAKGVPHRPNHSLPGEESNLVASGRVVDSIASRLTSVYSTPLRLNRPRFFGLTDEEVTALDPTALSDPSNNLRKRLMVALTGGGIGVAPPMLDEVLKRYDEHSQPDMDGHDPLEWFIQSRRDLPWYIPARTAKNQLGLVHRDALVGDLVAILHGFQVPIVLRPTNEGSYTVVGQCYLEDAMFGEAMTWKEDEADQFTLV